MSCKYMDDSCREEKMGCEGCAYYEKSADEMFKDLGYEKFYENTDTIRYSNNNSIIIEFRNGMKAFDKSRYGISIQELQAINKKVEELRMEIKTKYAIGQRVWVLIENKEHKEVELFSDTISNIVIYENKICYFLKELCDDIDENVLIAYEDAEKLLKKIIDADKKMNFREENNAN